jgi:2-methylcitrate dehydratase PrpD
MRAHELLGSCLAASLILLGCKKDDHDPEAHGEGTSETTLEVPIPSGDYELTASDMPLTEDFRKAATKLVTPDNYREQISRVERELAQLAEREERDRQLSHDAP